MKSFSPIPCRIKVHYHYYHSNYGPTNGYLRGPERYNRTTGKVSHLPLEFDSVEDAVEFLTGDESRYFTGGLEHNVDAQFSCPGVYVANHNEYCRPSYRIVSAKSGRTTKAIITQCNTICA